MATNSDRGASTNGCGEAGAQSDELHKAAFHGDLERLTELLRDGANTSAQDKHGNTALHIAVMLGHKTVIQELVERGAPVKEKNNLGWTPLDEAISYGDQATVTLLLRTLRDQTTEGIIARRQELIKSLQDLDDCYAELRWEFHTWVPLLSRLLPSDICRIYKTGNCIRLDSTLGDFSEMQWKRGDMSFIFNGEDNRAAKTLGIIVLDNQARVYQRIRLINSEEDIDTDLKEQVQMVMKRPIIYANMSTQPITVSRAQAGWFYRVDRSERVGEYETDVYHITNLVLIARKRREHLSQEQIQKQEATHRQIESGDVGALEDLEELHAETVVEEDRSLPPPPPSTITWDDYINSPEEQPLHLGRPMDLKIDRRGYKASVFVTEECQIDMKRLLDILEVIAPYKHFHKLRQFVHFKLPPGFPVKLDIPVFPTVTAVITLERYEHRQSSPATFLIPRDYKKFVSKNKKPEANNGTSDGTSDPSTPDQPPGATN